MMVIAIDGFSGTGKSSTAKQVAAKLGYQYIDSGAMYRAATLYFLNNDVELSNHQEVMTALGDVAIELDGGKVKLNTIDVTDEIRTMKVNKNVSQVSAIPAVRKCLVDQQRSFADKLSIVMDGRDIGTVVFPSADVKFFMTADLEVRVSRRVKELQKSGIEVNASEIKKNLLSRDQIDSSRDDSPLKKASDAIEIDTSYITLEQQIEKIVNIAKQKTNDS